MPRRRPTPAAPGQTIAREDPPNDKASRDREALCRRSMPRHFVLRIRARSLASRAGACYAATAPFTFVAARSAALISFSFANSGIAL